MVVRQMQGDGKDSMTGLLGGRREAQHGKLRQPLLHVFREPRR